MGGNEPIVLWRDGPASLPVSGAVLRRTKSRRIQSLDPYAPTTRQLVRRIRDGSQLREHGAANKLAAVRRRPCRCGRRPAISRCHQRNLLFLGSGSFERYWLSDSRPASGRRCSTLRFLGLLTRRVFHAIRNVGGITLITRFGEEGVNSSVIAQRN